MVNFNYQNIKSFIKQVLFNRYLRPILLFSACVGLSFIIYLIYWTNDIMRYQSNTQSDVIKKKFTRTEESCSSFGSGVNGIKTEASLFKPSTETLKTIESYFKPRSDLKGITEDNAIQMSHEFIINYDITEHLRDNKAIQNISLQMPKYTYENLSFEISCSSKSNESEMITVRDYGQFFLNHNYREPPVTMLPLKCHTPKGKIKIGIKGQESLYTLRNEADNIKILATLWDKSKNSEHNENIDLYLSEMGYAQGEEIVFYVHSLNKIDTARIDIYHIEEELTLWASIENLSLKPQSITPYSFRDGANWEITAQYQIPVDAPSGYYVAVVKQNDNFKQFPFIIRPKTKASKKNIAIIAATNTWQAYNSWGDGSFYQNTIGKKCLGFDYNMIISTKRPFKDKDLLGEPSPSSHLFIIERFIPKWMQQNNYKFDAYIDTDLHRNPNLLNDYDIVVLPTHPEYYSRKMYDHLEAFQKNGGSIIYLGGNGLYYNTGIKEDKLEKNETGRKFDLVEDIGGMWSFPYHNRSQAGLLGVEYDSRDYATYLPYQVRKADHPFFRETNLKNGDLFADKGSGQEMDVVNENSPEGIILLAKGINPKGYGSEMVTFYSSYGGRVFAVSGISFIYAMLKDKKSDTLLRNVFDDFITHHSKMSKKLPD